MLRSGLAVLALAAAVGIGCHGNGERAESPFMGEGSERQAQLAAFAASSKLPTTQSTTSRQMAVLVNRSNNDIRILNFSDQSMQNVKVWVNGTFVRPVVNIPPHSVIVLKPEYFYDSNGQSFEKVNTTPSTIQIQSGDNLYKLQGPIYE